LFRLNATQPKDIIGGIAMDKQYYVITYEYGYSGEIIVLLNGKRYCTVDNWEEYRAARNEIFNQNVLTLV
jgi:hypothetical protein